MNSCKIWKKGLLANLACRVICASEHFFSADFAQIWAGGLIWHMTQCVKRVFGSGHFSTHFWPIFDFTQTSNFSLFFKMVLGG